MRWSHLGLLLMALSFLFLLCSRTQGRPGDWYGTTLAWVEIPYQNVVVLLWTNPPDADLDTLRFYAWDGQGDTLRLPDYMGHKEYENSEYVLFPGQPDTLIVTLPCRTGVYVDWKFWMQPVDTAGNVGGISNIATWRQEP